MCMCTYFVSIIYTQFNFHKLLCYERKPFNSKIYHTSMCCIKCVKFHMCSLIVIDNYMCMVLRGPIAEYSTSTLNGTPLLNKDY